jgi:RNA polymerase sigma-70 factor, ECF subfamily
MLTARNFESFESQSAELPHSWVANALTVPEAQPDDARRETHQVSERVDALVAAAQAGDRAALDRLLANQRPRAMAAALRVLHNPDDAEDAVQEAFLKIWRSLASFAGRSSFSTWVHRIVTNASLDILRKSAARPEIVERPAQNERGAVTVLEPTFEATPESELTHREVERLVRLAVAALPAAHRQAVELRELEDCSYQEIAETIPCPIGTVMSRLYHARARLADNLRVPLGRALAA